MRLLAAILLSAALVGPRVASAADGTGGGEPFQFLFLDANARAVGMGGAYTALASDSNALLYNPAGLGTVQMNEATFMHNQYFESASQEYISLAMKRGFGFSLNYLGYGSITRTTYATPDGTGSFGASDLALSGGYGRIVADGVSVGASLKYIRESIDNFSANTLALDTGVLYAPARFAGLTFGLALQNLGPSAKFERATESLPINLRGGAAYRFKAGGLGHTVAIDLSKARTQNAAIGFGFESVLAEAMAMRIGYNTRNDAGLGISGGIGWVAKAWGVDYAIVPFGDLGLTHRLSVTYRWGSSEPHE